MADQGDFRAHHRRALAGDRNIHGSSIRLRGAKVHPRSALPFALLGTGEQRILFVGAALLLNKLVSKDGALDITVAGFVHLLAFLAAFARLLWVTRRERAHALLWIGALVALTDAGYAVYWNSWYAEPASCIFFLLLLAEAVEIAAGRRNRPGGHAALVVVGGTVDPG